VNDGTNLFTSDTPGILHTETAGSILRKTGQLGVQDVDPETLASIPVWWDFRGGESDMLLPKRSRY
jgi:hypothetical protein